MKDIENSIMYKEGNILKNRIEELNKKVKTASKEAKEFIEKDIRKYEYALKGENKVVNALMNSNIPMLILHDLNIQYKDHRVQIDFMLITRRNYYILECKNTYGNILVDNDGNFYRTYYGKKVGIYNPIDKLDRNIDTIKLYLNDHSTFLEKLILNKAYDNFYHGLVVLSNENTIVDTKSAPRDVKNKIVRVDKLVDYIKKIEKNSTEFSSMDDIIKESADRILSLCIDEDIIDDINETNVVSREKLFDLNEIIKNKLKNYRNYKAKQLNYKPYYIFNDKIFTPSYKELDKWISKNVREIFTNRLYYWYNEFEENIPKPSLRLRKMTTRWGVCNTKSKVITLNTELFKYDIECLDYVVIHELSHLVHANHSKEFWNVVSKYCPNYKILRNKLKD